MRKCSENIIVGNQVTRNSNQNLQSSPLSATSKRKNTVGNLSTHKLKKFPSF